MDIQPSRQPAQFKPSQTQANPSLPLPAEEAMPLPQAEAPPPPVMPADQIPTTALIAHKLPAATAKASTPSSGLTLTTGQTDSLNSMLNSNLTLMRGRKQGIIGILTKKSNGLQLVKGALQREGHNVSKITTVKQATDIINNLDITNRQTRREIKEMSRWLGVNKFILNKNDDGTYNFGVNVDGVFNPFGTIKKLDNKGTIELKMTDGTTYDMTAAGSYTEK